MIRSPATSLVFLRVQGFTFLEPSDGKGNACSVLGEEYCELFQLVFLLPLLSPEYSSSVTSHSIVHTVDVLAIC
jgi:hypothetical protein